MTGGKNRPEGAHADRPDFAARMEDYRSDHPLPPATGLKADKAFYDSLYEDEPGDGQFQLTDLA